MNPPPDHHQPNSSSPLGGGTTTRRKIGIPVDLSDESAYAVKWAVQNYLREGDAVTLVHVRPTSVLYGADWGSTHFSTTGEFSGEEKSKLEEDFDTLTSEKLSELAQPLSEAKIPYKVHVVKDHDMKERLCLEIERLGMSVVIMGSRGFGASRKITTPSTNADDGHPQRRLGSVSDYCVHHCVCPVVVVRYPDDEGSSSLRPVPEEEPVLVHDHDQPPQLHLHKD